MARITTIAFDADDTLWQNEHFFQLTTARFAALLRPHTDAADLDARLTSAVTRNLRVYGFGAKGFALSMVETALEITDRRVPGTVIAEILTTARDLISYPVELLPQAASALSELGAAYRLLLVTKGDVFDQERKIAASGLAGHFAAVEIVADKTAETYRRIFDRHGDGAQCAVMVGNSLRSDILPALAAGSFAVFVPHALTWAYEHDVEPLGHPRFARIDQLGQLPQTLAGWAAYGGEL